LDTYATVGGNGMPGQQIYGCLKDRVTWFIKPADPKLGDVEVTDLIASLAMNRSLSVAIQSGDSGR
jgi:hypothetical protein